MNKCIYTISIILGMLFSTELKAQKPERVILFMIDGLHWQAPQLLQMPVLNSLIKEGTYIEKSYMILPHHPTIGDYSTFNSCSFPNPVLHEGTIFLTPENKYIQEVFSPKQATAFVVNTTAYRSVSRGFTTVIMDPELSDRDVVEQSMQILRGQEPVFMRIHLQTPGDEGTAIAINSTPDQPYYRNIFGEGSPYVKSIEEADVLLGELISFLKKENKWNNTVLIVTSDHGQSRIGWHPLFDDDSWVTPMVFTGPGIARNRKLDYFEHTDLAPTIAGILGANPPNNNGGAGKFVTEIFQDKSAENYKSDKIILKLNEQIREFNLLRARMLLASQQKKYFLNLIAALENENLTPEPFYHQDRIIDWNRAGDVKHLLEVNEQILKQMRLELKTEK